jgi:dUTP pyrophosphatase
MSEVFIKFKKVYDGARSPEKAHSDDCGWDLHAFAVDYDKYGNMVIDTGIAVAIPEGYGGFLFPRSSISKFDLQLTNAVGVIDPGLYSW